MDEEAGMLRLPWISRIARPSGVCRRGGRGFVVVEGVERGVGCKVIEGILARCFVVLCFVLVMLIIQDLALRPHRKYTTRLCISRLHELSDA